MKVKFYNAIGLAAVAGVIGLGGLALNESVSATTENNQVAVTTNSSSTKKVTTTTKPSSNSNSNSNSNSSSSNDSSSLPSTSAEQTTATPDTGLFTGDGEFTQADGLIILTGILSVILLGVAVYHNRKPIFRRRVSFNK